MYLQGVEPERDVAAAPAAAAPGAPGVQTHKASGVAYWWF